MEEWLKQGEELFGEDKTKWQFTCPHCKQVQSWESIKEQNDKGIPSQRYGVLEKGSRINVECTCYSPTCNWTANGLFTSGILVIHDMSKPYDEARKENCYYVFPFAYSNPNEVRRSTE